MVECRAYSPFYEAVALRVADDPAVLALAARASPGQPPPNLLLGAVHFLLLRGAQHPLSRVYARLAGGDAVPGDDGWPAFRAFCVERASEIEAIVASRRVQTNEVGRTAFLRPAILAALGGSAPRAVALVEIGASAGLNLVLDRHAVRYRREDGTVLDSGRAAAPVVLECSLRGPLVPPTGPFPAVVARRGVDLDPVDVRDADAVLWLRALVWPDQPGRDRRLLAAVAAARDDPPPLVRGDAASLLPAVLAALPEGVPACVYHSAVWQQVPPPSRAAIAAALLDASRSRTVAVVAAWSPGDGPFDVRFASPGPAAPVLVARAHAHGAWLEWLAPP